MSGSPWLRRLFFWGWIVAGVGAFAAFLHYYNLQETWEQIRTVGLPCILATTATALMTLVIPAVGWMILLRAEGVRASWSVVMKANLMGFVLNILTPSMYLAGEPLKAFYVAGASGASKRRVLATIVVSKFQEFAGIVLALLVAVFFYIATTDVISKVHEVLLVGLALVFTLGLMLVLYAIVGRLRPTVRMIDQIGELQFMKGRLDGIRKLADELEYRMYASFVHRSRTFMIAQAITLLSVVSLFLRPMVFLWFVPGQPQMRFDSLCMIYIIFTVIHMFQLTPGGLGMHEWGVTHYFGSMVNPDPAFPQESAMAFILLSRFADVIFTVAGAALLWHAGLMKFARGKEQVPMEEQEPTEPVPVPEAGMKVLKRVFLAAHHAATGKTRRYVAGQLLPRPTALRIGHLETEEGFHLLSYGEDDGLMADTLHRTLEDAMTQALEEYQVRPAEWEDVGPL